MVKMLSSLYGSEELMDAAPGRTVPWAYGECQYPVPSGCQRATYITSPAVASAVCPPEVQLRGGTCEDTGAVLEVLLRIGLTGAAPDLRPVLVCVDAGVGEHQLRLRLSASSVSLGKS